MSLDRTKAPLFSLPVDFSLQAPQQLVLACGTTLFYVPTPGIDAVKLEIIGKSDRNALPLTQALVPYFTLQLLQEGTRRANSREIAEFFDFHAAEVHPLLSYSHEGLSLLCLKKHLGKLLPMFISLFSEANFPANFVEKRKSQHKLSLSLEREKPSSRASQLFKKCLFGAQHPYGQEITEDHVNSITPEILQSYYSSHLWKSCDLFLCGDFTDSELYHLCSQLNALPYKGAVENFDAMQVNREADVYEDRPLASQSSLRIGAWSISKKHPDFPMLSISNALFGGFFGSRLVKNIREEKGHTYGITSSLMHLADYNYWVVAADVKKEFRKEVIADIHQEMKRLQEELVSEQELEVLRNYLIGQLINKFSSPFDTIDQFKAVYQSGLDFSYYDKRWKLLQSFTAEDILHTSRSHLRSEACLEVCVG